jgi:hypothetical protein
LNKANSFPEYNLDKKKWVAWGKDLLSMAVVAVIITAPLGAILTNTLGVIWLNDDSGEEPKKKSFTSLPPGESYSGDLKMSKKVTAEFGTSTNGLGG